MNDFSQKCINFLKMGRYNDFEKFGIRDLPCRKDWEIGDNDEFPTEAFYLRGSSAEKHYAWNRELKDKWNGGLLNNPETFVLQEEGVISARNSGVDYGYGDAQTISFELPREKVNFEEHPAVKVVTATSSATRGARCTLGRIERGVGSQLQNSSLGQNYG